MAATSPTAYPLAGVALGYAGREVYSRQGAGGPGFPTLPTSAGISPGETPSRRLRPAGAEPAPFSSPNPVAVGIPTAAPAQRLAPPSAPPVPTTAPARRSEPTARMQRRGLLRRRTPGGAPRLVTRAPHRQGCQGRGAHKRLYAFLMERVRYFSATRWRAGRARPALAGPALTAPQVSQVDRAHAGSRFWPTRI